MLETKDFAAGCLTVLTVLLCLALIPLFIFVFKLSLLVAIGLAVIIGVIVGISLIGRIVRIIFFGKK